MTIIGLAMVRDEEDVLDHLLAHMIGQGVDRLVIADNLSTDSTPEILHRWSLTSPVEVRQDNDPGYYQARKMTALLHSCGAVDGDWILPFDADEWWYPTEGTLGEVLPDLEADVLRVWGWNHYPNPTDADDPNPFTRMQWREPGTQKHPKVWFRYHPDAVVGMGNHDVTRPGRHIGANRVVEFRHMGVRSFDQFTRKARNGAEAYEATDLPHWYGTHWREWGAMTPDELRAEYDRFCCLATVHDPAPA